MRLQQELPYYAILIYFKQAIFNEFENLEQKNVPT